MGAGPQYQNSVGTWRDLDTGVNPVWFTDFTWADGATDQPGDPGGPIPTRLEGPWGLPWWEGLEDTNWHSNLPLLESPNPTYFDVSAGAAPIVGAYEGAFRTDGPVRAWGHEPSGGTWGDQAVGRIMRFPANIPDRYDRFGVSNIDYREELAASLAHGSEPIVTYAEMTTSLNLYPSVVG